VAVVIVIAGLLAGTGWLYVLRGLHWLSLGPRVSDALPLLQLAAADGQPVVRVIVAWVLAGALTGVALGELRPGRRAALALLLALVGLLLASQASYALARNSAFASTVFSRTPGLGPVLEACAFALGCYLPRPAHRGQRPGPRRRSLVSVISGLDDRGVGGGERRHPGQHDRDPQAVHHARGGARA
jgi:apolipoprotein N-acyltransferase